MSAHPLSLSPSQESALIGWTQAIYGLHAFSLLMGIVGAATVIGAFLTGWPSIIAVILNYVKRSDVRGTWLESHFRWQIRTFWFGLLWVGALRRCSSSHARHRHPDRVDPDGAGQPVVHLPNRPRMDGAECAAADVRVAAVVSGFSQTNATSGLKPDTTSARGPADAGHYIVAPPQQELPRRAVLRQSDGAIEGVERLEARGRARAAGARARPNTADSSSSPSGRSDRGSESAVGLSASAIAAARPTKAPTVGVTRTSPSYKHRNRAPVDAPRRAPSTCADCSAASSWKRPCALLRRRGRELTLRFVDHRRATRDASPAPTSAHSRRSRRAAPAAAPRSTASAPAGPALPARRAAAAAAYANQPDGFLRQADAPRIGSGDVVPAAAVCRVDRVEHGVEPRRQLAAIGNLERDAGVANSGFRAAQALPHRRRRRQKRAGDRRRVEAEHDLQHQRRVHAAIESGCAQTNSSFSRSSGNAPLVHRRSVQRVCSIRSAGPSAPHRRARDRGAPDRSAAAAPSSTATPRACVGTPSRGQVRSAVTNASLERIFRRGNIARARREERDEPPVRLARDVLDDGARVVSACPLTTSSRTSRRDRANLDGAGRRRRTARRPVERVIERRQLEDDLPAELLLRVGVRPVLHAALPAMHAHRRARRRRLERRAADVDARVDERLVVGPPGADQRASAAASSGCRSLPAVS